MRAAGGERRREDSGIAVIPAIVPAGSNATLGLADGMVDSGTAVVPAAVPVGNDAELLDLQKDTGGNSGTAAVPSVAVATEIRGSLRVHATRYSRYGRTKWR